MNKSQLLGAVCATALVILSNTAHAAIVSQISGLDIGGTLYDVTFHTNPGNSFLVVWDADNDGVFGGGSSVLASAPTFWGDQMGAQQAAQAIMTALGTTDGPTAGFDGFLVPYGTSGNPLSSATDTIRSYGDFENTSLTNDDLQILDISEGNSIPARRPYASFALVVPVPPALWLFGSGLVGLVGIARRKV